MEYCVRVFFRFVVGFLRENLHQVKCLVHTLCFPPVVVVCRWRQLTSVICGQDASVTGYQLPISRTGYSSFVWFVYLVSMRRDCMPLILFFILFFFSGRITILALLFLFPFSFQDPKDVTLLYSHPSETLPFNLVTVSPTHYYVSSLLPVLWFIKSVFQYFHTYSGLSLSGRILDQSWPFLFLFPLAQ